MLTATQVNERQEEMFLFAVSRFWYFVIVLQSHARGISSLEHEFFSQRRGVWGGGGACDEALVSWASSIIVTPRQEH